MAYNRAMDGEPTAVVETPQFIRQAERLLSDDERFQMIEHLAWNPEAGVIIPGTVRVICRGDSSE